MSRKMRVVIEVNKGEVIAAYTDDPVDVIIVNHDNDPEYLVYQQRVMLPEGFLSEGIRTLPLLR